MGAECWQMTACEATSYTRFSPCLQPHTGLISMPTAYHGLWINPSVLQLAQSFTPSIHLSLYLFIYHFVPVGSHVCTCSFGFQDKKVSLLCPSSVFLFATCWCLSILRLCQIPFIKVFKLKRHRSIHTSCLLVFHTNTQMAFKTQFKIQVIVSVDPKLANIIVWSWVLSKLFLFLDAFIWYSQSVCFCHYWISNKRIHTASL